MRPASLVFAALALLLTGCTLPVSDSGDAVPSPEFTGTVKGGQAPIGGATISVYEAGTTGYGAGARLMASTTSDSQGNFNFATNAYTCSSANAPMYITAEGGNAGSDVNVNIMQIAVLGPCTAARKSFVVMNELSTAATAIAMAPFMDATLGQGVMPQIGATCTGCASGVFNQGLIAAMTNTYPMLYINSAGSPRPSFTVGNVTVTTEASKLYSFGNTLASCVNSSGEKNVHENGSLCGKLFKSANAPNGSTRPYTTLQVALMMALYPSNNAEDLFDLAPPSSPWVGMTSTPNDWTMAISYTSSDFGLGVNSNSSASFSVDSSGRIWLPSTKSTAHGIVYFDPADQTFHGPYVTGLTHPQYVAVDNTSNTQVWADDMGSGPIGSGLIGSALTAAPTAAGTTYSGGSHSSLTATGPLFIDGSGNVAFAGIRSSLAANYVLLAGQTTTGPVADGKNFDSIPTGYSGMGEDYGAALASTGGASAPCRTEWILGGSPLTGSGFTTGLFSGSGSSACNSGGAVFIEQSSGVYEYMTAAATANRLCLYQSQNCSNFNNGMSSPQGLAVDGSNRIWIANSGNSSISELQLTFDDKGKAQYSTPSQVAFLHGTGHGATMTTPYGIAVDPSGNVWVQNAGCTTTGCTPGSMVITEVVGAATPVATPLSVLSKNQTYNARPVK